MNKAELVDALEGRLGGRKQATAAVEAVVELITLTVAKGDKVAISGFGTFEKQARNARTGRNPRTGEAVKIKKTSVPRFRPGTAFKEVVSDSKALRAYTASLKEKNGIATPTKAAAAPATATKTAATRKTAAAAPVRKAAVRATTAKTAAAPRRASTSAAAPAAKKAAPAARRTAKKA